MRIFSRSSQTEKRIEMKAKPYLSIGLCVFAVLTLLSVAAQGEGQSVDKYFGKSIDEWIEALSSEQKEVRSQAARTLVEIGSPAYPALSEVLSHYYKQVDGQWIDSPVWQNTVESLVTIGPSAVPVSLALIRLEQGVDLRHNAGVSALLRMGKVAGPALEEALQHQDIEVRGSAVVALRLLGMSGQVSPSTLSALITVSKEDRELDVRLEAIDAFGAFGFMNAAPEVVITTLIELLDDAAQEIRVFAAASLVDMKYIGLHMGATGNFPDDPTLVAILTNGLKDPDEMIRYKSASALEILGTAAESSVSELTEVLQDDVAGYGAAQALGNMGAAAIPELLVALQDSRNEVRANAAMALRDVWPDGIVAVPLLIEALNDPQEEVREHAVVALGVHSQGKREDVEALIAALEDESVIVRSQAATALGRIGSKAHTAVPALIQMLDNHDEISWVRRSALAALGDIGPAAEQAIQTIVTFFNTNPAAGLYTTTDTLKRIGVPAISALTTILLESDEKNREQAARAFFYLGHDAISAVPVLMTALADSSLTVRKAAMSALGAIGPTASPAIAKLINLSQDDDLQTWAVDALIKIDPDAQNSAIREAVQNVPASNERIGTLLWLGETARAISLILDELAQERGSTPFYTEHLNTLVRIGGTRKFVTETLSAMIEVQGQDSFFSGEDLLFRIACAKTFLQFEPENKTVIEFLTAQLDHSMAYIRYTAIEALVETDHATDTVRNELRKLLSTEDKSVAIRGAALLARIPSEHEAATTFLEEMSHHKDYELRFSAVVALANAGKKNDDILQTLLIMLHSQDKHHRIAAVKGLQQVNDNSEYIIGEISELLHDLDKDVRETASIALFELHAMDK